jgi:hypothetical protein
MLLTVYSIAAASFALTTPAAMPRMPVARAPAAAMLDIPRVELPDAIASTIKEQGLKSPNELGTTDYNTYSAAAIGGTLIFFLLPLFNIFVRQPISIDRALGCRLALFSCRGLHSSR